MTDYDHSSDRYLDAKAATEKAAERVQEVVGELQAAAGKLDHWREVGFEEKLEDGGFRKSMKQDAIDLDNVPSFRDVRDAVNEYHQAEQALRGAIQSLPSDKRQMLGLT